MVKNIGLILYSNLGEARPYAESLPCKALLKGKTMDLQSGIGLNSREAAVF